MAGGGGGEGGDTRRQARKTTTNLENSRKVSLLTPDSFGGERFEEGFPLVEKTNDEEDSETQTRGHTTDAKHLITRCDRDGGREARARASDDCVGVSHYCGVTER